MTQTLRRERRTKFESDIQGSLLHYYARLHLEHNGNTPEYVENTLRECREDLAAMLAVSAESRSEKLSQEDLEQVNKKVDAIIGQAKESQSRIDSGTGWRGRELLPPDYLIYGDWWHGKTGLHMYGAKSKARMDSGWLKAFKELFENEVSIQSCNEALEANKWRNISNPLQIVNDAKAVQAAPAKSVQPLQSVRIDSDGIPETY